MEFLNNKTIKLDKEINELDKFLFKFLDILEKYTNYVIVRGYISILFGRSRATEDIDLIIPKLDKSKFKNLFENVINEGFWCINTGKFDEAYGILTAKNERLSVRFAINKEFNPNIELKFSKNKLDKLALKDNLKVLISDKKLIVSTIESQIIFKEEVLKDNKDLEDALHLRKVFKDKLDINKLEEYKKLVKKTYDI